MLAAEARDELHEVRGGLALGVRVDHFLGQAVVELLVLGAVVEPLDEGADLVEEAAVRGGVALEGLLLDLRVLDDLVDDLRQHAAGQRRQRDTGGEQRVDERGRVADAHPAVTVERLAGVGPVARGAPAGRLVGAGQHLLQLGGALHLGGEQVLQRLPVLAGLLGPGDVADADGALVERDRPEPALVQALDQDVGVLVAGEPLAVVEVRPDRDVAQLLVPRHLGVPAAEQPGLAGGVDDQLGPGLVGAVRAAHGEADAGDPAVLLDRLLDGGVLDDVDTELAGPVQDHRVHVGAAGVERVRVGAALDEREVPRHLLVAPDQRPAVLALEAPGVHPLDDAQLLHRAHEGGDQRLADVVAREALLVEDHHAVAALGEQSRRGGPGGTAADDDDVEFLRYSEELGRHA